MRNNEFNANVQLSNNVVKPVSYQEYNMMNKDRKPYVKPVKSFWKKLFGG